jgi:hypothetical protein
MMVVAAKTEIISDTCISVFKVCYLMLLTVSRIQSVKTCSKLQARQNDHLFIGSNMLNTDQNYILLLACKHILPKYNTNNIQFAAMEVYAAGKKIL